MAENWIKFNFALIFISVVFLVVISLIIFSDFGREANTISNTDQAQRSANLIETNGLNNPLKLRDLSFELNNVILYKEGVVFPTKAEAISYHLFLSLNVTNNGETMENITYFCGKLLFDGGTQYNFDVTAGGRQRKDIEQDNFEFLEAPDEIDLTGICDYTSIVPGATITIYDDFYFSDTYYRMETISWEEVLGSKIAYFTQQNNGLLKFVFDKKDAVLHDAPNILKIK